MVPRRDDAKNLLVPVAVSASHVAFNSVRLEPTWMILGQSAGVAAAMANSGATGGVVPAVQDVNITLLQQKLVQLGQKLVPSSDWLQRTGF